MLGAEAARCGDVRSVKATMVVTAITTAVGTILVVVGIALLVLPGPGLLLIAAGLALLARNFTWAEDLLHRARTTIDHRRERRGAHTDAAVDGTGPADDASGPGESARPLTAGHDDGDATSGGNSPVMPAA